MQVFLVMTLLLITKYEPRFHVTFLHLCQASPGSHYVLSCSLTVTFSAKNKHSSVVFLNLYFLGKGILNYLVCLTYNKEKPVLVQNQIFLKNDSWCMLPLSLFSRPHYISISLFYSIKKHETLASSWIQFTGGYANYFYLVTFSIAWIIQLLNIIKCQLYYLSQIWKIAIFPYKITQCVHSRYRKRKI